MTRSRVGRRCWRAAPVAAALVLAACIPLPGGHSLSRRQVTGKQGAHTLIADDGATCAVTAPTFEKVQVGDDHTCAWKEAEDRSGPALPTGRQPRRPEARP